MGVTSVNPATGETLTKFDEITDDELERRIGRGAEAFRSYRRTSLDQRGNWMHRAAELLEQRAEELGRLMTLEMGKPLEAAIAEARKCALGCSFYAENAERFLATETVSTGGARSYVRYDPIGPVLAIMPWNFPFWQVFRFAAPSLMAGNVALLKHASNVPQCALQIERLINEAGFPEHVFQTLLIGSARVGRVIDDPRVRAVTLTGSEKAGAAVAEEAGRRIKKTVLELGGSDPFIVMPSADLGAAVRTAVQARVINNGQSCIAAKRFIVSEDIADEFERRFVEGMEQLRVGDPMERDTDLGPLATPEILDLLDRQVRETVVAGARLLTGGRRLDRPGNYYAPTVLADIPAGSPAYHEELFGPVATLFRARDVDHAIEIANDSPFGLGSSAWTNDEAERRRFIEDIEAGLVFINGMVASDPRLPFGGVKRSGYGRELAEFGIREFVNIKTVRIETRTEANPTE